MTQTMKYNLYSQIMGNNPRTVESHHKEGRLYVNLLSHFTEEELKQFIATKEIPKLRALEAVSNETLEIISKLPAGELDRLLSKKNETSNNTLLLKNALFKVEHGLDTSLVLPILENALKIANPLSPSLRDEIIGLIRKTKLRLIQHENHREIVLRFIKNYLTDEEITALVNHFKDQNL